VIRALVSGTGEAAEALKLARAYTRGDWDAASAVAVTLGIGTGELASLYMDAIAESDAQMSELAAAA